MLALAGVFVCVFALCAGSAGASVSQFGSFGEGAGQFNAPQGVAVDQATGDVYLMDFGNVRIDKWTGEGGFLLAWGWGVADATQGLQTCTTTCYHGSNPDYGPGTGEFGIGVRGVAVDNDPLSPSFEDVYVPDPGNNRVEKFDPSGGFLAIFGREVNENGSNVCVAGEGCQPGKEGSGEGEFDDITGAIAVGSNGNVYVGGNERVQVFGPEGVFVKQFAVGGRTHSIAVDEAGDLYVVGGEFSPHVLSEYDSSGALLRILDGEGDPQAVTFDGSGDLFVDDLNRSNPEADRHHLLEYGPGGEEIANFDPGSEGADGREGIAVGDGLGGVYVPNSNVRFVPMPVPGPELAGNESANGIQPSEATLSAGINPENNSTTYRFDYGPTSAYGSSAPSPQGSLPASFNDEYVSATITKLIPGTTYHYRIVATDSKNQTTIGPDATFTTPTAVLIDSEYATNVASTSATIGGELNPLGAEAAYRIEYDTSEYTQGGPSHGTVLAQGSLGSGSTDVPVSTHTNALEPDTLYHYRIVASDTREGVQRLIDGPDHTFLTQVARSVFVLPDGRQWEQVSPVDKHGATVELVPGGGAIQASSNGDRISYIANASTESSPEGNRSLEHVQLLSMRGTGGWSTQDIDTPNEAVGGFTLLGSEYRLFSPDLSTAMVEPRSSSPLPPLPQGAEKTIYLRNNLDVTYEPLVTTDNVVAGAKFGGQASEGVEFRDATPDLSRVVLESFAALTPDAIEQDGRQSLYEWSGGKLVLVSVLPDGESGNQQTSAALGDGPADVRHAISDNGNRVVWRGGSPTRLYLRDVVRKETVQIDAPQGVRGAESKVGGAHFQTADSAGSRLFFTSTARLTTDATRSEGKSDLYVFEVTSSAGEPLAGKLIDLTVDRNAGESADVQGVIGASEDGTSIFFAANGLLGDAAGRGESGSTYLYMERYVSSSKAWSEPHLIAALSSTEDAPSWGNRLGEGLSQMSSRVTPGGRFLAFMSSRSLTGYDNRDAGSGMPDEEVFLYDTETGRLSCVSCEPTGARPAGMFDETNITKPTLVDTVPLWNERWLAASIPPWVDPGGAGSLYQSRYLFDSGRLLFDSQDALVPSDTNGTWDVYEFEPKGVGDCTLGSPLFQEALDGCVGLISSGGSKDESVFLDASETGDDVFFLTKAGLAPGDGDRLFDVYDAHVCSVSVPCLPAAPVSLPACSTSDSCKPAPTPQPESFGAPASQTFSGVGQSSTVGSSKPVVVRGRTLTRAQKLARALKACAKKHNRNRRMACERQAKRRYGDAAHARGSKTNQSLPTRAGR
jgi:hypothetical protein